MAFTQGFENDVFISYSHRDNLAPRWVDHFHDALLAALKRKLGDDHAVVWRDQELDANSLFNQKIKRMIDSSAVFLVLLSRNYLKSQYCMKELDWFYSDETGLGISIGDQSRIFIVLLNNIPHEEWPGRLKGTTGQIMHDAPKNSVKEGDFYDFDSRQFRQGVKEIANAITITLKAFPGAGPDKDAVPPGPDENDDYECIDVFIADAADNLQITRDRLIEDLKREKVRIPDEIPPPDNRQEHDEAVKHAVAGAHLAIHLLDNTPGRRIRDCKESSYPRRQLEIGLESDTHQLTWVPKHLDYENIEDETYKKFLYDLEFGERVKKNFNFVRELKTGLKDLVLTKVEEIRQHLTKKIPAAAPAPVLLSTREDDLAFTIKLASYLDDQGIKYQLNPEYRNIEATLKVFDDFLERARSVVIVCGAGPANWVQAKLLKILKFIGTQMMNENIKTTLENLWLFRLPSSRIPGKIQELTRLINIQFLDNTHSHELDERVLEPLLQSCKPGGGP
ncbi:MAG: toll/interleukin-1 receptor domain-containing protein [Candidatus Aminicenantes bacterium]|nr:MAG: toll/interleukin-1 receptor domain-containing protein [Candidatus Aminicenantes bacterium]